MMMNVTNNMFNNYAPQNRPLFKNFDVPQNRTQQNSTQTKPQPKPKENKGINIPVLGATIAGTVASMMFIKGYQNKKRIAQNLDKVNIFNIKYDLKEMLIVGMGSTIGGLTGGVLTDKKHTKHKVKEAIYQYLNLAIPQVFVAGMLNVIQQHEAKIKKQIMQEEMIPSIIKRSTKSALFAKALAIVLGIGIGMPTAALVSCKLNSAVTNDSEEKCKRKIKIKDAFVHTDDIVGALVLSGAEIVEKLHLERLLPILYLTCGYESGNKK